VERRRPGCRRARTGPHGHDRAARPVRGPAQRRQRQRAWIALTLAQETELLLLDEPTTFLDLRHQLDVLDLVVRLQRESARTVVVVLHDLGQAARYADQLVVLRAGRLVAAGPPREVLDAELVAEVFEVECRVVPDPETGTPLVVPAARHGSTTAVTPISTSAP
jgi:iron complex transport system ATP-binding protein